MFRTLLPDLPRLNSSSFLVLLPRLRWCKAIVMKSQVKPAIGYQQGKGCTFMALHPDLICKDNTLPFSSDSPQTRLLVCPTKKKKKIAN